MEPNYIARVIEKLPPSLVSHKASKSRHYATTMDSHTRQAICFNYVNHFILFSNICRELQATAGQNRTERGGRRRPGLVLVVTCHMVLGCRGRVGRRSPRKCVKMQGGSNVESPFSDKSTPQHTAQSTVMHFICASGGRAGSQQAPCPRHTARSAATPRANC